MLLLLWLVGCAPRGESPSSALLLRASYNAVYAALLEVIPTVSVPGTFLVVTTYPVRLADPGNGLIVAARETTLTASGNGLPELYGVRFRLRPRLAGSDLEYQVLSPINREASVQFAETVLRRLESRFGAVRVADDPIYRDQPLRSSRVLFRADPQPLLDEAARQVPTTFVQIPTLYGPPVYVAFQLYTYDRAAGLIVAINERGVTRYARNVGGQTLPFVGVPPQSVQIRVSPEGENAVLVYEATNDPVAQGFVDALLKGLEARFPMIRAN